MLHFEGVTFLDIIRHIISNFVPTKDPCTNVIILVRLYRTATMVKSLYGWQVCPYYRRSGAPPLRDPGSAPAMRSTSITLFNNNNMRPSNVWYLKRGPNLYD